MSDDETSDAKGRPRKTTVTPPIGIEGWKLPRVHGDPVTSYSISFGIAPEPAAPTDEWLVVSRDTSVRLSAPEPQESVDEEYAVREALRAASRQTAIQAWWRARRAIHAMSIGAPSSDKGSNLGDVAVEVRTLSARVGSLSERLGSLESLPARFQSLESEVRHLRAELLKRDQGPKLKRPRLAQRIRRRRVQAILGSLYVFDDAMTSLLGDVFESLPFLRDAAPRLKEQFAAQRLILKPSDDEEGIVVIVETALDPAEVRLRYSAFVREWWTVHLGDLANVTFDFEFV